MTLAGARRREVPNSVKRMRVKSCSEQQFPLATSELWAMTLTRRYLRSSFIPVQSTSTSGCRSRNFKHSWARSRKGLTSQCGSRIATVLKGSADKICRRSKELEKTFEMFATQRYDRIESLSQSTRTTAVG